MLGGRTYNSRLCYNTPRVRAVNCFASIAANKKAVLIRLRGLRGLRENFSDVIIRFAQEETAYA